MKLYSVLLIAFCVFFILFMPGRLTVVAVDEQYTTPVTLSDFLRELDLSFNEYLDLVIEIESAEAYPHFIEKNAGRYERFQIANPDIPLSTAIAYVNASVDIPFYENISVIYDTNDVRLLVNKHHALPEDWAPDDLVSISYGRMLREEAAEAFERMKDDMNENRLYLHVVSAFREYSKQNESYTNSANWYGEAQADNDLARAGHSEHQSGLAVDILHRTHSGSLIYAHFQDTDEFKWLSENAHNYGFILRYPESYAQYHGYTYEPWHWRYVGVEAATFMYNTQIAVYEEFYGKFLTDDVFINIRNILSGQQAFDLAAEKAARFKEKAEQLQTHEILINSIADVEQAGKEALSQALKSGFIIPAEPDAVKLDSTERIFDIINNSLLIITATAITVSIPDIYEVIMIRNASARSGNRKIKKWSLRNDSNN